MVADEIVSGLDVSTQAQILLLLKELKEDSLIFISHDLSVVRVLCDRVLVLHRGRVVESGPCEQVFSSPQRTSTPGSAAGDPVAGSGHPLAARQRDARSLREVRQSGAASTGSTTCA
jgi:peptide/nickel transport system ATP-binding protein